MGNQFKLDQLVGKPVRITTIETGAASVAFTLVGVDQYGVIVSNTTEGHYSFIPWTAVARMDMDRDAGAGLRTA